MTVYMHYKKDVTIFCSAIVEFLYHPVSRRPERLKETGILTNNHHFTIFKD
jgi:hypothetical protein